jgi:hypothetical protein
MDIFAEIKHKVNNKKVVSLVNKLTKRFSTKSFNDLSNLQELAYWLYTLSEKELSEKICNRIIDEKFNDVELWAPIEYLKALKCKLCLEKGNVNDVQKYVEEIMGINNNSKGFIRRLNGELLPTEEINNAKKDNDIKSELIYLFSQIPDLVLIEIMNGKGKIKKEEANNMIKETIEYIIKNIK